MENNADRQAEIEAEIKVLPEMMISSRLPGIEQMLFLKREGLMWILNNYKSKPGGFAHLTEDDLSLLVYNFILMCVLGEVSLKIPVGDPLKPFDIYNLLIEGVGSGVANFGNPEIRFFLYSKADETNIELLSRFFVESWTRIYGLFFVNADGGDLDVDEDAADAITDPSWQRS